VAAPTLILALGHELEVAIANEWSHLNPQSQRAHSGEIYLDAGGKL
jgi:hypothetical protein